GQGSGEHLFGEAMSLGMRPARLAYARKVSVKRSGMMLVPDHVAPVAAQGFNSTEAPARLMIRPASSKKSGSRFVGASPLRANREADTPWRQGLLQAPGTARAPCEPVQGRD